MNWYNEHIEEPIRKLVRLLRNNGFNTECSCGHEMYVQCQVIPDGELQRLHRLLYEHYGTYRIDIFLECIDGFWVSSMNITIPKGESNNRGHHPPVTVENLKTIQERKRTWKV